MWVNTWQAYRTQVVKTEKIRRILVILRVHYLVEQNLEVFLLLSFLVLIRACGCLRPSWIPKRKQTATFQWYVGIVSGVQLVAECENRVEERNQPAMAVWFRIRCSTRSSVDTCTGYNWHHPLSLSRMHPRLFFKSAPCDWVSHVGTNDTIYHDPNRRSTLDATRYILDALWFASWKNVIVDGVAYN